ncbi:MAG: hypothetical protein KDA27_28610, partial [Candidatus Eisenbacteria bacterium]|nr:hypothetical protein [Candidatus Eisenbacteria bacterium]
NYVNSPNQRYLLPDTTGGFFSEFEILPSWRAVEGQGLRHPCMLYVDAFNGGAQPFIEAAFDSLGYEVDRYDYLDATSNWKAPMARWFGGYGSRDDNNGCTIFQLLGYRGILVNSGSSNVPQLMWPEDYGMFSDWLTAHDMDGRYTRQGLLLNGDGMALALQSNSPTLMARLGATLLDSDYASYSGNLESCVRIESPSAMGEAYGTSNSANDYVYDAYGNWCPQQFEFDVIGTSGVGVGNRVYVDGGGFTETEFAQVVTENIVPDGMGYLENYRTILDGVSWHHLAAPDAIGGDRCVSSLDNVAQGAFNELAAAVEWIYDVDYSGLTVLCREYGLGSVSVPGDSHGAMATRLYPSAPNPFAPRTTIRFNLATTGPAELAIYDVAGRRIRTLAQGTLDAGPHDLVWDGTDDAGHSVPSGTYWM